MVPADIKYLVVHCSATPASHDIGLKEIDRWHRAKGWLRIGYHHVIRRDGTVEDGRPHTQAGAHEPAVNRSSIGYCLIGGLDKIGRPQNNFTPEQMESLTRLLKAHLALYPGAEVLGHRDIPGVKKDCPCFDVRSWWSQAKS